MLNVNNKVEHVYLMAQMTFETVVGRVALQMAGEERAVGKHFVADRAFVQSYSFT